MPPKASKKTVEKAKQKVIEDKTFGLKNKNRSAKVQAYVQEVTKNVRTSNRDEMKKQAENESRKQAKADKKAFEAAMSKLLGGNDKKDDASSDEDEEGEEGEEGEDAVVEEEYLWRPEDFDEVDMSGRMEEALDAERDALIGRTDLTPVTEESFRAWREKKKAEKAAAEKTRVEQAKKGAGKLKGRDLWNERRELFVDDEDGEEVYEKEFNDASLFDAEMEDGDDDDADAAVGGGAAPAAASK